jgi:hypothetical protein
MILFPGRHLMGVFECHQLTSPNNMVELKTHELCVKNQVEFMVQLVGTNHVNPCSHLVANLVSKQDPKIARLLKMCWENPDFSSPKFDFPRSKSNFLHSQTDFPQRLYEFPQRLSKVL